MRNEYLSAQLKDFVDEKYKKARFMNSEKIIKEAKLRNSKKQNAFLFLYRIRAMSLSIAFVLAIYIVISYLSSSNGLMGACMHTACLSDSGNYSSGWNNCIDISDRKSAQNNPRINTNQQFDFEVITAGEWNDNLNWSFFQQLISEQPSFKQYLLGWGLTPTSRIAVTVTCDGKPVEAAKIRLIDSKNNTIWTSVTNNNGIAYLFYNLYDNSQNPPFKLQVISGIATKTLRLSYGQDEVSVEVSKAIRLPKSLDLMFAIDTTSSMYDELSYIKSQIEDVVSRISEQNIDLRLSYIFYRDEGDEYVVRSYPFVNGKEQINAANAFLKLQQAAGGGNEYPDAVDKALEEAVYNLNWSDTSTAKLLFLIHDSPAYNNEATKQKLHKLIQDISAKGIRIIPVSTNGISLDTEFLMRSLAITSGGTYVFFTDSSENIPSKLKPTIGEFEAEQLNDLMVRIINTYLK